MFVAFCVPPPAMGQTAAKSLPLFSYFLWSSLALLSFLGDGRAGASSLFHTFDPKTMSMSSKMITLGQLFCKAQSSPMQACGGLQPSKLSSLRDVAPTLFSSHAVTPYSGQTSERERF